MRTVDLDTAIQTAQHQVAQDYSDMLRAMIMDLATEGRLSLEVRRLALLQLQDYIEGHLTEIENALRVS